VTSDRWKEINRIYDAAVEVEEKERASFLQNACGEDVELRREVESLLAYDQQAQQFIDRPALQLAAEKLAVDPPSLVGRQLGPYQILGVLGAGGMGEVFTARDTRLNRTVAIKVLPRHFSERADLRQRFEREAKAISSLSHPNICALHDIGRQDGIDFLVMEYLEGETLSQRLRKGPLPTSEVMRYAIEIAGALEQAHRKGVVHRDLKPGNIILTETGAKLLDFGLAKRQPVSLIAPPSSLSPLARGTTGGPTETKSLTEEGMILGTLEYMAPEQLEGKEADARTDLFALGVVIYEMATGQKAFQAESKASLIAKILTAQPPPIETIQPVSPPELDRVVQRCLAKKPEERWQSAAELTSQFQEIAEANLEILKAQKRRKETSGQAKEIESKAKPTVPVAIPEPRKVLSRLVRSRGWKLSFVGILLALITGSLAFWRVRRQPERPAEKPEMSFKALTSNSADSPLDSAAISPDGKYLAFSSKGKLFVQVVHSGEKNPIVLPEGFPARGVSWFPDGTKLLLFQIEPRWIKVKGEVTRESGFSLWSLSIPGGTPKQIVDRAAYGSVSPDGSLVAFSRRDHERKTVDIWLVGANGESPRRIRAASEHQAYYAPVWSSNGQRLFYFHNGRAIESCDLRGETVTTVVPSKENRGFWNLCLAPNGRMIFALNESQPGSVKADLWEIKVDTATGSPLSEAMRLTQLPTFGSAQIDDLSITADGKSLVVRKGRAHSDVYVADLEPGGKGMKDLRRLTIDEADDVAWDWRADSRVVFFQSNRNGNWDIFKQDISQTDVETVVASRDNEQHPSLSPDGAFVLYLFSEKLKSDATRLMRIPVGGGPPEVVLTGEKIKNFSCAREVNLCVVAEDVAGKQILTTFDPLKGRGKTLPQPDYPGLAGSILSLQGRWIDKMKQGPEGLQIRVRSLTGGSVEQITFKNLIGYYDLQGWSLDGKGIYLYTAGMWQDRISIYAGLNGDTHIVWKRVTGPGYDFGYPVPSPDGRQLAFTVIINEMNAWMLENF